MGDGIGAGIEDTQKALLKLQQQSTIVTSKCRFRRPRRCWLVTPTFAVIKQQRHKKRPNAFVERKFTKNAKRSDELSTRARVKIKTLADEVF